MSFSTASVVQDPTRPIGMDVVPDLILNIEGLTVSFDGHHALDDLTLNIRDGELRCLIGANGAGKTTLMDVISGKTECDNGSVLFDHTINLLERSEAEIACLGIGRKFEKSTLFEAQSVFANLELSLKTGKGEWQNLFAKLNAAQRDRIDSVLETIGLSHQRSRRAGALSPGQKQWLEIGMLLVTDPRLLLLDEPVAGMTAQESERLAELLVALAGERTVLVAEHDMEFVHGIARTVTVLHQGRVLAEGTMNEIQNHPQVRSVCLGAAA